MRVTIQLPDDISAALEEQWDDVPQTSRTFCKCNGTSEFCPAWQRWIRSPSWRKPRTIALARAAHRSRKAGRWRSSSRCCHWPRCVRRHRHRPGAHVTPQPRGVAAWPCRVEPRSAGSMSWPTHGCGCGTDRPGARLVGRPRRRERTPCCSRLVKTGRSRSLVAGVRAPPMPMSGVLTVTRGQP